MKARISGVMGIALCLLAEAGSAEAVDPIRTLKEETARLRAELVVLRRIRSAQRELIEWTRVSEGARGRGTPGGNLRSIRAPGGCVPDSISRSRSGRTHREGSKILGGLCRIAGRLRAAGAGAREDRVEGGRG